MSSFLRFLRQTRASGNPTGTPLRTAIILPLVALVMAVIIGSLFVYAAAWIKDGTLIVDQPLQAYGALISGSLLSFASVAPAWQYGVQGGILLVILALRVVSRKRMII